MTFRNRYGTISLVLSCLLLVAVNGLATAQTAEPTAELLSPSGRIRSPSHRGTSGANWRRYRASRSWGVVKMNPA